MKILLENCSVCEGGGVALRDIAVDNGAVCDATRLSSFDKIYNLEGLFVFPGFVDVHVHFREPGFSYKETISSGTKAAAHGGYTDVCTMPNLSPVPDSPENLAFETKAISRSASVNVHPYASITQGQTGEGNIVDMSALSPYVIGFSDDGKGVKYKSTMEKAMYECRRLDKIIAAHCEDMSYIQKGASIHAGKYAAEHSIPGIPSESEWKMIERDIELCKKTGCKYHVCHVSCKESVQLIRNAKESGVNISCETAPHYLLLTQDDLRDDGRFKMNPPLRDVSDKAELIRGINDGTIDMIATDHAPHSAAEKSRGLSGSLMGIVGLETAFPVMYTYLVKPGIVTLERLITMMTSAPRKRFGITGGIEPGMKCCMTIWDLNADSVIDADKFLSKGRPTPFDGWRVQAECATTVIGENVAYVRS